MKILIANIGSTSFKYRLLETQGEAVLAQGKVERIGRPGGDCPDHDTAIRRALDEVVGAGRPLGASAFRVVVALPAQAAARVLGPLAPDAVEGLRQLRAATLTV